MRLGDLNIKREQVVIISGLGDAFIDNVISCVNYEMSGDGQVLVNIDEIDNCNDSTGEIGELFEKLRSSFISTPLSANLIAAMENDPQLFLLQR